MRSSSPLLTCITVGLFLLLIVSITMNIMLLSSYLHTPQMLINPSPNEQSLNNKNCKKVTTNLKPFDNNKCHFDVSLEHKVFVYNLPWHLREEPSMRWYEMFNRQSHANYNDTKNFNFGFGDAIKQKKDFHSTHMHSLEIILNERFKKAKYYLTDNEDEALIFFIPFPFAQHFRYYHRSDHDHITGPHNEVYKIVNGTTAFSKYFGQKPHILLYGRIAYETGRMGRMGSKFWSLKDADSKLYWHLSIDRNCHGDPPSCYKRISMPHPSNFHPQSVESLKERIDEIKQSWTEKREILIAFCGAVRTPQRKNAMKECDKMKYNKWGMASGYKELCRFEDSDAFEQRLKEKGNSNQSSRKRHIESEYGQKCIDLYDRSAFCLQDGADSTTRKALWDGIIAGCIPVFLSGVMSAEFECFGGNLDPWYIVLQPDYYIKQIMSLPKEYVLLLRRNLLRMIPKILYTNGEAGFSDAFDVILHCLVRKTAFENQIDNKGCSMEDVVAQKAKLYDFDSILGYDKLYKYLQI